MVDAKKIETATHARSGAVDRGIGVEAAEIINRTFPLGLHAGDDRLIALLRAFARAELVETHAHPRLEKRHHGAHVVGDDLQSGPAVEEARKYHTRHRRRGLEGPAKHPPDIEARALL